MDPMFWWGLALVTPVTLELGREFIVWAKNNPKKFVDLAKGALSAFLIVTGIVGATLLLFGFLMTINTRYG